MKEKASSDQKLNLGFTREKDEFLGLSDRIASNADLLLSTHVNFAKNTDISGVDCFIAKDSEYKSQSEEAGKLIVSELSQLEGIKTNTTLRDASFMILEESKCPALLLNIGYLSNPNDLSFITNTDNQGAICDKILSAINRLNEY